jgi:hypothetical protein
MMNTLANHGILPHDGRNITREAVIKAMKQGLNFDSALAVIMFDQAVIANPEPNATFFTLYVNPWKANYAPKLRTVLRLNVRFPIANTSPQRPPQPPQRPRA